MLKKQKKKIAATWTRKRNLWIKEQDQEGDKGPKEIEKFS